MRQEKKKGGDGLDLEHSLPAAFVQGLIIKRGHEGYIAKLCCTSMYCHPAVSPVKKIADYY